MKFPKELLLLVCAVLPLISFFPFELHYAIFRAFHFLFPVETSSGSESFQAPGFSYRLLQFFQNGLPFAAAGLFLVGLLVLRSSARNRQKIRSFYLLWSGYFVGALSYFAILHLVPFLFAVVTLALLANVRDLWIRQEECVSIGAAD